MISEEEKKRAINLIKVRLGTGNILILSLTGSRAFGWGSKIYDIDIRGIYEKENYWSYCHLGLPPFDINLSEMRGLFYSVKSRSWTIFEDLSKPFLVHPLFDFKKFMSLCSSGNVRYHLGTIEFQRIRAERWRDIRTILHAYRLLVVPLYFLETNTLEINVDLLNRIYLNSEILDSLIKEYKEGRNRRVNDKEWALINGELNNLWSVLKETLDSTKDQFSMEDFKEWVLELTSSFGRELPRWLRL